MQRNPSLSATHSASNFPPLKVPLEMVMMDIPILLLSSPARKRAHWLSDAIIAIRHLVTNRTANKEVMPQKV
jgi:hypothetical protein